MTLLKILDKYDQQLGSINTSSLKPLNNIEDEMDSQFKFRTTFYKYDRLALADSVLRRIDDKIQTSTYL